MEEANQQTTEGEKIHTKKCSEYEKKQFEITNERKPKSPEKQEKNKRKKHTKNKTNEQTKEETTKRKKKPKEKKPNCFF